MVSSVATISILLLVCCAMVRSELPSAVRASGNSTLNKRRCYACESCQDPINILTERTKEVADNASCWVSCNVTPRYQANAVVFRRRRTSVLMAWKESIVVEAILSVFLLCEQSSAVRAISAMPLLHPQRQWHLFWQRASPSPSDNSSCDSSDSCFLSFECFLTVRVLSWHTKINVRY